MRRSRKGGISYPHVDLTPVKGDREKEGLDRKNFILYCISQKFLTRPIGKLVSEQRLPFG